ncbi:MAG TPA: hypothetical protein VL096_05890, partial [Pirellulaceae bacterium]|nr:hypothetical protein [Pirellulaceae bacterium]
MPTISSSQVLPPNLAAIRPVGSAVGGRFTAPPAPMPVPMAAPVAPQERWYLLLEQGQQYGPVPRLELDQWYREGRITAQCQLLLEGSPSWQWAPTIYPALGSAAPLEFPAYVPAQPFDFTASSPGAARTTTTKLARTRRSEWVDYSAYSSYFMAMFVIGRAVFTILAANVAVGEQVTRSGAGAQVGQMAAVATGVASIISLVVSIIFSLPWFFAGMGVSSRRPWGRILTFVMCGLAILCGMLTMGVMALIWTSMDGAYWDRLAKTERGRSLITAM